MKIAYADPPYIGQATLISGIPDSVIYGSSVIDQTSKKRSFFLFRNRNMIKSEFYLIAKMDVNEVIRKNNNIGGEK